MDYNKFTVNAYYWSDNIFHGLLFSYSFIQANCKAKHSCNKTGEGRGLYTHQMKYEIMKLKIDNIRTVNETPIPCFG